MWVLESKIPLRRAKQKTFFVQKSALFAHPCSKHTRTDKWTCGYLMDAGKHSLTEATSSARWVGWLLGWCVHGWMCEREDVWEGGCVGGWMCGRVHVWVSM